jgi:glycosyltransferase involved in cell wall biosynthesis
MKICIITDFLKPQCHGIAIRFEEYIENLRLLGHEVIVYGPSNCPTSNKHLYSITNRFNPSNRICFPTFEMCYDLITNNYDIVHMVYPAAFFSYAVFIIHFFKLFKIVTSNHVMMNDYGKVYLPYPIYFILYYICSIFIYLPQLLFVDKILGPSSHSDFDVGFKKKIEIIPTGINLSKFTPSFKKRDNILLYVGRLALEKNLDKLCQSIPINYKLQIIGDGPYKNDLKKKYACDNIEFLGKVNNDELCKHYQNAKAHITFSEYETYCLTLLESVACGTPIIYPNCDVFNEIYQNDFNELCLRPDNNLIQILSYIDANEIELQHKCRNYAEKKSWVNTTKKLVSIYQSTLDEC